MVCDCCWVFECHCVVLVLPLTPSVWNQMTVELTALHLVGDCCIFLVSWVWVPACGTGALGADVKSMSPATVGVVAESSCSMSWWWALVGSLWRLAGACAGAGAGAGACAGGLDASAAVS